MTPHPPPRRFNDRDLIARGAVLLAADPDPVRQATGAWLRDVAQHYRETSRREIALAVNVARPALLTVPATTPKDAPCSTT